MSDCNKDMKGIARLHSGRTNLSETLVSPLYIVVGDDDLAGRLVAGLSIRNDWLAVAELHCIPGG